MRWRWELRGKFLVRSLYNILYQGGGRTGHAKIIWGTKVPLKGRAFVWLVPRNAILTMDNLMKRKWQAETMEHLLLSCNFAAKVWELFRLGAGFLHLIFNPVGPNGDIRW